MIHNIISSASKQLDSQIHLIKQKIATYPEGSFFCVHDGNRIKWFYRKDNQEKYISKKDRHLAEQLANKKYLSLLLIDYEEEKQALDHYLKHCKFPLGDKAISLLSKPEYSELLSPAFLPLSQELSAWMNTPYEPNPAAPQFLIHSASNGKKVRSKSEVLIDMLLATNGIPFRYESPLIILGKTYYPDFTIRHPITGEFYYWEHLGLMDNPEYLVKNISKLHQYIDIGIYPGDKLILTYETSDKPLTTEYIQKTIQYFFM